MEAITEGRLFHWEKTWMLKKPKPTKQNKNKTTENARCFLGKNHGNRKPGLTSAGPTLLAWNDLAFFLFCLVFLEGRSKCRDLAGYTVDTRVLCLPSGWRSGLSCLLREEGLKRPLSRNCLRQRKPLCPQMYPVKVSVWNGSHRLMCLNSWSQQTVLFWEVVEPLGHEV